MKNQRLYLTSHINAIDSSEIGNNMNNETLLASLRAADQGAHRVATTLQAAAEDPHRAHLAKQAVAMLVHAGVQLDVTEVIDPFDLSRRMKAADVPLERRYEIKTALAQLGVL